MVKRVLFIASFFISCVLCAQQNLVENPSFEDTVSCPNAAGDINKSIGWTTFCGSPDYYNTCDPNSFNMGVPFNWAGYQIPASGNAYAGFVSYSNSSPNAREFPAYSLSNPLNIGTKYYVSFKISLALTTNIQANCASDKIGVIFTMGAYSCNSLINNNPSVYTDSIITDSLNWTRISGSFVADSSYEYLVIGNFFDDVNTDTVTFFSDFLYNAYYYLDDICVSTDSIYSNNYAYNTIEKNNVPSQITCFPNPVIDNLTIQNFSQQKIDVIIYNVLGETLFSFQNVFDKTLTVNLIDVNEGIVIVKIISEQQIDTYKLLKL